MTAYGKTILTFLGLVAITLLLLSERSFLFGGVLCLLLLVLSYIDLTKYKIPDWINALILITGVLFNIYNDHDLLNALISFLIAGSLFYFISFLFFKIKNRQGLGGGDIKLFAASAVWLNFYFLPFVLLISSLSALIYAVLSRSTKIPFGPFLAIGIWVTWLFGSELLELLSTIRF
ncbi:prepilin peptidase [Pseudemcibacter aquimaris]|uniref:prepilin peptidase n=1 Tax=Pseudemcibacter aquimaris TaxID=2857064 RepID=UPI0020113906|nr:A24 family peptidase [Pseudemcibacter aquimaris]MCC3861766.1 A24 family peptidase [Pseudemcibacter aquimaris]WDU58532.1 A24 family peptidase [Pseudemcibacter aquimaris]